jgi:hypothetical protein
MIAIENHFRINQTLTIRLNRIQIENLFEQNLITKSHLCPDELQLIPGIAFLSNQCHER